MMRVWLLIPLVLLGTVESAPADDLSWTVSPVVIKAVQEVAVSARDAGTLTAVDVKEGDTVAAGQTLARIDDGRAQLQLDQARIDLRLAEKEAANDVKVLIARKSSEVAHAELTRAEEAIGRLPNSISAKEMDRLRLTAERAELEILQAEHELAVSQLSVEMKQNIVDQAQEALSRRQITAPIGGTVVAVLRQSGESIQAGETCLRIINVERLRAEGFLPAERLDPSLKGAKVRLSVDFDRNRTVNVPARIAFISPEADPITGQVRIWAECEPTDDQLWPGLEGTLHVTLPKR